MGAFAIVLVDMRDREQQIRRRLQDRVDELQAQLARDGVLEKSLQDELNNDISLLGSVAVIDPVFKKVQEDFNNTNQTVADHRDGVLPSQAVTAPPGDLTPNEKALAAAFGVLEREGQTNPDVGRRFFQALANGRAEYNGNRQLYDNVLVILRRQGTVQPISSSSGIAFFPGEQQVSASQWASVTLSLINQGVPATDFHLDVKVLFALAGQEGVNDNALPSSISIDIPDFDSQTNVEIIVDNLQAAQGIYFSFMFEEMNGFRVMEALVQDFTLQRLPFGRGTAGDTLYSYWKKSVTRMSEIERRNLYARMFGAPGGDPSAGSANADFQDLFLKGVSAVSSFARQLTVDDMFRTRVPGTVNQEQVKKALRDLAGNISLHGYGIAYFAATELQSQVKEIIALLSDDEVKGAYGAKDMWGVIDQVASLELGTPRNTVKYRTLATASATIIKWLADHANDLTNSTRFNILSPETIRNPPLRPLGAKATTQPTDRDFVDACEAWLSATGTTEQRVEEYSQRSEAPMYTSAPIRLPQIARDMLESAGVQPFGYVNGKHHPSHR